MGIFKTSSKVCHYGRSYPWAPKTGKKRREEKEKIRGGSERDNGELVKEGGGVQVALQLTHQFTWTTLNMLKSPVSLCRFPQIYYKPLSFCSSAKLLITKMFKLWVGLIADVFKSLQNKCQPVWASARLQRLQIWTGFEAAELCKFAQGTSSWYQHLKPAELVICTLGIWRDVWLKNVLQF